MYVYLYIYIACMVIVCSGYLIRHGLVSVQNELSFQKVVVVPGRKKWSSWLKLFIKQVYINLRYNILLFREIILTKTNNYIIEKILKSKCKYAFIKN